MKNNGSDKKLKTWIFYGYIYFSLIIATPNIYCYHFYFYYVFLCGESITLGQNST